MLELDELSQQTTVSSLSEGETYGITEEFLLNNLLLFALRKNFLSAADALLSLYRNLNCRTPPLALWCLIAMKEPSPDQSTETICTTLDSLISIASDFSSNLESNNCSLRETIDEYVFKAKRVLMHLHLESFSVSGDHAVFLRELNRLFPASDSSSTIRSYRFKFSKLILSRESSRRYLNERWLPHRCDALKNLHSSGWNVAHHFPAVIFDKLGTDEWKAIDTLLLQLDTAISVCLREHFRDVVECDESTLLAFAQLTATQSTPSQLF